MKKHIISTLACALLSTAAAAEEPAAQTAVTSTMPCSTFEWAEIGEHLRAAIVVPVTINGRTYDFQLDTGADVSFIPEKVAVEAGLMKPGDGGARVADVRLGGTALGPRWFLTRGTTGTIGLDMLVGYATVIDYPAQRFCVTPTSDLPYPVYKETRWSDAVLRHGKLFVPVTVAGEARDGYFFDTGASLFPLSVDFPDWKALTGRDEQTPSDRRISGPAWGVDVELVGAVSQMPVGIADLAPKPVEIFYKTGGDGRFANYPFPARGLIGNAAVWDYPIVLWLGARPQFGIVSSASTD